MKSLRLTKNWSQDELAQLSGLNVRTIQRLEKGEKVGVETLKALASVFEISVEQLRTVINEEHVSTEDEKKASEEVESRKNAAIEKAKSIKQFYFFTAFLVLTYLFTFVPNYNGGENLGPLIVGGISFAVLIVMHGFMVFQPFGEKWEKQKAEELIKKEDV